MVKLCLDNILVEHKTKKQPRPFVGLQLREKLRLVWLNSLGDIEILTVVNVPTTAIPHAKLCDWSSLLIAPQIGPRAGAAVSPTHSPSASAYCREHYAV